MDKTTATGVTVTCEKATNDGLFSISPMEAFFKLKGSIKKLEKPIIFTAELTWVIEGTPLYCTTCGEYVNNTYYNYCPACGEEMAVFESYKSLTEAKKSLNYDMGVTEKVTFWARTKNKTKDLELKG